MNMDLSELTNGEAMQRFIDKDKTAYHAFALEMERYSEDLEAYLESSNFGEAERENYSDYYEDLADDMSDMFEVRREAIEDLYEDRVERKIERLEDAADGHRAALEGLDAALKELEFVECEMCSDKVSESQKAQLEALKRARKDIEKAQKDAKLAYAQAERSRSVALANAEKLKAKARAQTEIVRRSQDRHEDFRDKVMQELLRDGLIKSANETVFLSHPNGKISLNGKPIANGVGGKYCKLWDAYGFTDDHTEITIQPDSLKVLTDLKNGEHRSRVTYGTSETEDTSH